MRLWILGDGDQIVNAALVSAFRVQREQGAHAVMASVHGGGQVCIARGSEGQCKARLETIRGELVKAGGWVV